MDRANLTAAAIRALRTAIQGTIAAIGTSALTDVDWADLANVVGATTLVSFLTGILTRLPEADVE